MSQAPQSHGGLPGDEDGPHKDEPPKDEPENSAPAKSETEKSSPQKSGSYPPPAKPLLASEALKEDLAPIEPWSAALRWWMACAGVVCIAVGLAPLPAAPFDLAPVTSAVIGGVALAGAIAPTGYLPRAALMLVTALAVALLAMAGTGPAAVAGATHGPYAIIHLVAAIGLPAALMFRACYRAYRGARFILIASLAVTLPFVIHGALAFAREGLAVQVTTGVALVAIVGGLLSFLGSEHSVAGPWAAGAVMGSVAAALGVESLALAPARVQDPWAIAWTLASVLAFAAASLLGACGTFMVLAARHWRRARIVDLHRHVIERPPPSLSDSWSTHR
jgi:hypothetical protein